MKNILIIICLIFGFNGSAQPIDGVGINTTNPRSTLDINGTLSVKHLALTGSSTPVLIGEEEGVYFSITTSDPNEIFRLPDATLFPGRIYILRNVGNSNDARIETLGTGVEFFAGNNGTGGTTSVILEAANVSNKTLIFISDGSNWTYGHLGF